MEPLVPHFEGQKNGPCLKGHHSIFLGTRFRQPPHQPYTSFLFHPTPFTLWL
jgi:hypothetical protein